MALLFYHSLVWTLWAWIGSLGFVVAGLFIIQQEYSTRRRRGRPPKLHLPKAKTRKLRSEELFAIVNEALVPSIPEDLAAIICSYTPKVDVVEYPSLLSYARALARCCKEYVRCFGPQFMTLTVALMCMYFFGSIWCYLMDLVAAWPFVALDMDSQGFVDSKRLFRIL